MLPDCFIICGSYHVTLVPDEVIAVDEVDAVCIGEGEYAELELCDKMSAGEDYTDIESLFFKMPDGSVKKNPIRPLFSDLDRLPIPDFDLFDYDNLASMKVNSAICILSRGCLFNCSYCGNGNLRKVYPLESRKIYARFRSPENAMLYLKTLLAKHPTIKFLNFRDAIFNMFPEWFDTFIEMYKKEIGLPFTCNVRFDVLTEDTVRKMKEAGCYTIDIGVESGDEELRRRKLHRNMTDEMMINASKWFKKYGVTVLTYNIVGLPFEDIHKALKTIKLNAKLESDQVIPNIFYPYPMTDLEKIAREAGFVPDVIPQDCRVPLKQKQFPEHEVLFIASYFMHFVKRYKWAYKMPHWLGRPYEKWLDFRVTSRITPHKFLVFVYDIYAWCRNKAKGFLINRLPKLYIKLRKKKAEKRAAK
ncbi:MAG: radical SAM protein [Clostridia bacterium]|nr:radical SAM protein [Clostridia bacterium]